MKPNEAFLTKLSRSIKEPGRKTPKPRNLTPILRSQNHNEVIDEIYSSQTKFLIDKIAKSTQKHTLNKPFSESSSPEPVQINKPALKLLNLSQRSKIYEYALSHKDALYNFYRRKLFSNNEKTSSPILYTKNFSESKKNLSELTAKRKSTKKTQRSQLTPEKEPLSTSRNKSKAINNVMRLCNLEKIKQNSRKIFSRIQKEKKYMNAYTKEINWTSQKLKEIHKYEAPVLKNLFEVYQHSENYLEKNISKIMDKNSKVSSNQLIKCMKKRNKMKLY